MRACCVFQGRLTRTALTRWDGTIKWHTCEEVRKLVSSVRHHWNKLNVSKIRLAPPLLWTSSISYDVTHVLLACCQVCLQATSTVLTATRRECWSPVTRITWWCRTAPWNTPPWACPDRRHPRGSTPPPHPQARAAQICQLFCYCVLCVLRGERPDVIIVISGYSSCARGVLPLDVGTDTSSSAISVGDIWW